MKILLLLFLIASFCYAKEIAITLDDAPLLNSPLFRAKVRTQKILDFLREKDVKEALFLATPRKLTELTYGLLQQHSKAGHLIGNHSHSHKHFSETLVEEYIDDFNTSHHFLKDLPTFVPFYRYPFLDGGNSLENRTKFEEAMGKLGYKHAYVTVDTSEWFIEQTLIRSLKANKKIDYKLLGELYVESILSSANFFNDLAVKIFKREVKHTLLIHENEIAALYLGKLIDGLRSDGWKIITATKAYTDPVARISPITQRLNQGHLMAIAIDRGYQGPFRNATESVETIKTRIKERNIIKP